VEHGRFFMKGPSRGAASTMRPVEDVAVTVDISGRVLINDADTGALKDIVDSVFDGGYRWDGLRRAME